VAAKAALIPVSSEFRHARFAGAYCAYPLKDGQA